MRRNERRCFSASNEKTRVTRRARSSHAERELELEVVDGIQQLMLTLGPLPHRRPVFSYH